MNEFHQTVAPLAPGEHNLRLPPMYELAAILAGLAAGSFLNVCIVRSPRGESVVVPPSHCRRCLEPIRWYDNIPLLSFVLLRGHCRDCRAPIPLRYPLVEFLAALLVLALLHGGREPREALLLFALGSALIVVTFIDLDHRIIPDAITIPFIVIAPAAAFLVGHITVKESLAGALVGGGLLWAIARLYALVRKQEGMGLGDVKLLAMIGGLQGWQSALFTLGTASVSGAAVGLLVMAAKRGRLNMEIPFGPFLALGAVVYMFAGPALIAWYLGLPPLF